MIWFKFLRLRLVPLVLWTQKPHLPLMHALRCPPDRRCRPVSKWLWNDRWGASMGGSTDARPLTNSRKDNALIWWRRRPLTLICRTRRGPDKPLQKNVCPWVVTSSRELRERSLRNFADTIVVVLRVGKIVRCHKIHLGVGEIPGLWDAHAFIQGFACLKNTTNISCSVLMS